jgi:hypothetical protein
MWCHVVGWTRYDIAFCLHLQAITVYSINGGRRLLQKRWSLTAKSIVSLLSCPRTRQLYLTRNLATSRKCSCNCLYLLETWWKGKCFTTVFIFWRLDEKINVVTSVFIFCRHVEKINVLHLPLSSGDGGKVGNVFPPVSFYWIWDKNG